MGVNFYRLSTSLSELTLSVPRLYPYCTEAISRTRHSRWVLLFAKADPAARDSGSAWASVK